MGGTLARVRYFLLEQELEEGLEHITRDGHHLDAELCIESSDGSSQYISWLGTEPVKYCLAVKAEHWIERSFTKELDASVYPPWQALIGKPFSLVWQNVHHQLLEIRSAQASVYLSSSDDNCAIWVSSNLPKERASASDPL